MPWCLSAKHRCLNEWLGAFRCFGLPGAHLSWMHVSPGHAHAVCLDSVHASSSNREETVASVARCFALSAAFPVVQVQVAPGHVRASAGAT